jgi:transcriptional regulator with XRE-family HTH domain
MHKPDGKGYNLMSMKGRGRIDEGLKKEVGERLRQAFGGRSLPQVARMLDNVVTSKSLWEYVSGISLPGLPVQIKIADTFGITLDWLLTGKEPEAVREEEAPPRGVQYDQVRLRKSIEAVEEIISAENLSIDPDKRAELITIIYEDAMREGIGESEIVPRALRLLKLAT